MRRSIAVLALSLLVTPLLAWPATPAAAFNQRVTLEYPQAWPGKSMHVMLDGFTDCQRAGAPGYLTWADKVPLAGPFSLRDQPVTITVAVPAAADSGEYSLSATCPNELVSRDYGGYALVEVVPPPRPALALTPGQANAGDMIKVTGHELPVQCGSGPVQFNVGDRQASSVVAAAQVVNYRQTGAEVAELAASVTTPAGLSAGRYPVTVSCSGEVEEAVADVDLIGAPVLPADPPTSGEPYIGPYGNGGPQESGSPSSAGGGNYASHHVGQAPEQPPAHWPSVGTELMSATVAAGLVAAFALRHRRRRNIRAESGLDSCDAVRSHRQIRVVGHGGATTGPTVHVAASRYAPTVGIKAHPHAGTFRVEGVIP